MSSFKVKMLNENLLVQPSKKTYIREGGMIYVETPEDDFIGVVVALDEMIEDIKVGDTIKYKSGDMVAKMGGTEYHIINIEDVLCIIE